jgi:hypothetical protein
MQRGDSGGEPRGPAIWEGSWVEFEWSKRRRGDGSGCMPILGATLSPVPRKRVWCYLCTSWAIAHGAVAIRAACVGRAGNHT